MADVDVSVDAVVKVCSASVQLQDVARRFSHGSGNQGLKQEYIQKYTQMQELVETPLESNQAVVTTGDSVTLRDLKGELITESTEIVVADNKLLSIQCKDPSVAIISTMQFKNDGGTYNITVSNGVISAIEFIPIVTPPEE
ncbi:virion protein [Proteus phage vB_PmiP_RS8pmA]|uniref:Virion protein n=1 Tax=Proteus phage vB_PmiP_RS8pmA TaxID=2250314 RepID=A0A514CYA5_9CAUD|nr:virion protein [Proteus phage vB_PmiP_RS8pmA]